MRRRIRLSSRRLLIAAGLAGCVASSSVVYQTSSNAPPFPRSPGVVEWPRRPERMVPVEPAGERLRAASTVTSVAPDDAPPLADDNRSRAIRRSPPRDVPAVRRVARAIAGGRGPAGDGSTGPVVDAGASQGPLWPPQASQGFQGLMAFVPATASRGAGRPGGGGASGGAGGSAASGGAGGAGGAMRSSAAGGASNGTAGDTKSPPAPGTTSGGIDGQRWGDNRGVRIVPPVTTVVPGSSAGPGASPWTPLPSVTGDGRPKAPPVQVPEPGVMWLVGSGVLIARGMLKRPR